ncbi:MAG: DNA-formamidopyrimidine glycosylase [Patescibacteria group bacterium]|jgi:formamidopyrimidine-DNA glycosylase
MPELPEVETINRELQAKIRNHIISSIEVKVGRMINLPFLDFAKKLKGQKIIKLERRGKMMIWDLSDGNYLLIHLKMTGQLIYQPAKDGKIIVGGHPIGDIGKLPNKFSHITLKFKNGSKLFFNDIRKFGWMKLVDSEELKIETKKYGLEPLSREFTLDNFREIIGRYPNRKIKQVLLDQSLIAGIGNIYNDEICFCAKVLPMRKVSSLTAKEIKAFFTCIPEVLKFSISKKGTSSNTYVTTDGSKGAMVEYLNVYQRHGQKCKRCKKGTIKRIKLNGRGTFFCEDCQK